MRYREYKEGDTVRVTGCQGRLFWGYYERKLAPGVPIGVECVLESDEDSDFTVRLPEGILQNDRHYISVACIELVQAVEDKIAAVEDKAALIEHIDVGPDNQLFSVSDPDSQEAIARVWYDKERLPEEVAEAFADAIKAAYDNIVVKRKSNS